MVRPVKEEKDSHAALMPLSRYVSSISWSPARACAASGTRRASGASRR